MATPPTSFNGILTLKICSEVKGTSCRFRQVVFIKRESFTVQFRNVKAVCLNGDKGIIQVIAPFLLLFLIDFQNLQSKAGI